LRVRDEVPESTTIFVTAPIDELGTEGAVAVAGDVDHMLEELAGSDPTSELRLTQEVVLASVLLPRTPLARRCRDGDLELGHACTELADQRSLAGPGGTGDDQDGQRPSG
jgi:hypothetical protein